MFNPLTSLAIRPYLIRALYEWCTDNGFTPYVAVQVDDTVEAPREYVKDGEIVLNVGIDATSALKLGNEFIEFKARFAGVAREIVVPVGRVIAVYARENGEGMAFPALPDQAEADEDAAPESTSSAGTRAPEDDHGRIVHLVTEADADPQDPPRPPAGGGPRPSLKRVK
jgi:stringent starvation protein B